MNIYLKHDFGQHRTLWNVEYIDFQDKLRKPEHMD